MRAELLAFGLIPIGSPDTQAPTFWNFNRL